MAFVGYFWSGKHHRVVKGINHIFAAICGYVQLQRLHAHDVIRNCYRLRSELLNQIIAAFIQTFTPNLEHLNPQFQPLVNA